jgi:uncharacterized membrane protein YidH (DUF202 family)
MAVGDAAGHGVDEHNRLLKEELLISELQLLYAEKRTSLSILRTGIAVLTIPLSVFTILVATSNYYDILASSALPFAIPLIIVSVSLVLFGALLIFRAQRKIRSCDRKIAIINKNNKILGDLEED